MKGLAFGILFLSMVMGLSAQCNAEDLAIHLDGREWELGYRAKNDEQGMQEYVLKGEKIENWTELVTVQAYFGIQEKTTPEQFVDNIIRRLKGVCPNLVMSVINKRDKDIIFDWEATKVPGQSDQYEINRVISGKDALWYIHYVTKKMPVSPDERSKWQKLLSSAALQD